MMRVYTTDGEVHEYAGLGSALAALKGGLHWARGKATALRGAVGPALGSAKNILERAKSGAGGFVKRHPGGVAAAAGGAYLGTTLGLTGATYLRGRKRAMQGRPPGILFGGPVRNWGYQRGMKAAGKYALEDIARTYAIRQGEDEKFYVISRTSGRVVGDADTMTEAMRLEADLFETSFH